MNGIMVILILLLRMTTTECVIKKLNRKFIGIEKDEKYFEIACNRIGGE